MSDDEIKDKDKPTPSSVRKRNLQMHPENSLEIHSAYLFPQTGRLEIDEDLDNMYRHRYTDDYGVLHDDPFWGYFSTMNPDIRLSNLKKENEMRYVRWAMKMHLICNQNKAPKSAAQADAFRAVVTETSMARDMALMKNLQTIRQESQHVQIEETPKKRSIFGLINRQQGG